MLTPGEAAIQALMDYCNCAMMLTLVREAIQVMMAFRDSAMMLTLGVVANQLLGKQRPVATPREALEVVTTFACHLNQSSVAWESSNLRD